MGKLNLSSLNVKAFIGGYPFAWLTKKKQSQCTTLSPVENEADKEKKKAEKEPPYYYQYISKNKDCHDYTDYSGGHLGIL
jgi:hypothetical protein